MNNQVEKQILKMISSKFSETIIKLNTDKKGYTLYHDQTSIGSIGVRFINHLLEKNIIKFEAYSQQWNLYDDYKSDPNSIPLKLVLT